MAETLRAKTAGSITIVGCCPSEDNFDHAFANASFPSLPRLARKTLMFGLRVLAFARISSLSFASIARPRYSSVSSSGWYLRLLGKDALDGEVFDVVEVGRFCMLESVVAKRELRALDT
jgi:hypothetical protein